MYKSEIFKATDAKALLDNPIFKDAFVKVGEYLEAQALSCDPNDQGKAQRVIVAKQILAGIKREITKMVDDGDIAQIRMDEVEQRRGLKRFIR